jgi:putative hydrolase of the HAD superfamily
VKAIGFDLDDTLYEHVQFVRGAYRDVARAVAERTGLDADAFFDRSFGQWKIHGSRYPRIFSDTLAELGVQDDALETVALNAYRSHQPSLKLFPDVKDALAWIRGRAIRLGLLTDGTSAVQRRKVQALGLGGCFDVEVYTGDFGSAFYKPHERGFIELVKGLGVSPEDILYVGDNPHTDFDTAARMGMRVLRVRAGEHSGVDCRTAGVPEVADFQAAFAIIRSELETPTAGSVR